MSSLSSISGTKLSQHTHTSSPTGTKLSQHAKNCPFQPVLHEQGELCTARTTTPPSRENFVPHPAPNPVQNSPSTPTPAAQPVQNSPNTPKIAHFSPFCPSRENFVPLAPPRPPAGRTLYRAQCQTRYKTLPTRPKRPISARFARAGRTLYRSHHHAPQQGELCTAPSAKPGTKLSQHPRSTAVPRKSSPSTPHTTTEPRKSSPCTPKNGVFRLFRPCRANFFAHKQATSHTGRIFSRTSKQQATQGEFFRAQASNKPHRANYFAHWG